MCFSEHYADICMEEGKIKIPMRTCHSTEKGTPKENPKQQNCKCCWLGLIESVQYKKSQGPHLDCPIQA